MTYPKSSAIVAVALLVAAVVFGNTHSISYDDEKNINALWAKAKKLEKAGQPKAAVDFILKIKELALEKELYDHFLKSISHEIILKNTYVEDPAEEAIAIVQHAFSLTDHKISTAILHTFQAANYKQYLLEHSSNIRNRTALLNDTTHDLNQWGQKRFVKQIISHYKKALKDASLLTKTPLKDYQLIIYSNDEESTQYLKTVFDLIATTAIDYYLFEDITLVNTDRKNKLMSPAYFKTDQEFLSFTVSTHENDFNSLTIDLYQKLFHYHQNDKDPSLHIMLQLERLDFVRKNSQRADADELYRLALENLLENYRDNAISTHIQFRLAKYWNESGDQYNPLTDNDHQMDKVKAVDYCTDAIKAFPDSRGAKQCIGLKNTIQIKEIDVTTEDVLIPGQYSLASVRHKNIEQFYVHLYKIPSSNYKKWEYWGDREERLRELKTMEPQKTWMVQAPKTNDFQTHTLETEIPPLEKGYYLALFSSEQKITDTTEVINQVDFFASNLKAIIHSGPMGNHQGYVLNRTTGKPVAKAQVRLFDLRFDHRQKRHKEETYETLQTDKHGFFRIPKYGDYRVYRVAISKDDDLYVPGEQFHESYRHNPSTDNKKEKITTHIFTDRAIYRPGQTVYFKGIILAKQHKESSVKKNYATRISLLDANKQELQSLEVETNQYGSFNGTFVLPSTGLTGDFKLKTPDGHHSFKVEEYKRPRFEVEVEDIKGSYRLGEEIKVNGNATAYSGSNISQARVQYEILRRRKYLPYQYSTFFFRPPPPSYDVVMETGETITDNDGKFEFDFTAKPGEKLRQIQNSAFQYTIKVEVTDLNGESRTDSKTITAGDVSLQLNTTIPSTVNQLNNLKYKISATNLDGAEVPTKGILKIERLQQPDRLLKSRSWEVPDQFITDKNEFVEKFPHEQYKSELTKSQWEAAEEVFRCNFNTAKSDSLTMNCAKDWQEGIYRLSLTAKDTFGQEVIQTKTFSLYNPNSKKMPEKTFFWTDIDKTTAEPGTTVHLFLGSSAKKATIYYSCNMNGEILQQSNTTLTNEKEKISIPVKESWRGGFFINIFMVKEGMVYFQSYNIKVPHSDKKLSTQLITFRDKLKPGAKESWKLKLQGPEGEKVTAEMLASMYDASLDQFTPHSWSFNFLSNNYNRFNLYNRTGRVLDHGFYIRKSPNYHILNFPFDKEKLKMAVLSSYRLSRSPVFSVAEEAPSFNGQVYSDEEYSLQNDKADLSIDLKQKSENQKTKTEKPVQPRRNFNETAFFYPQLQTNENSEIILDFTMPESVTQWKFMTLAHTEELKYDLETFEVQTQKDLMVMPNIPRFFREDDTITISAKVSNLTDSTMAGTARLKLMNPHNSRDITADFHPELVSKPFSIDKNGNSEVNWSIIIPKKWSAVVWRITAETGSHTDGEENMTPILKNRMLVKESMPMSVRAGESKSFEFEKLKNSAASPTIEHHSYTLEVTQNPAWYAVQALPYLADFPHECSEQIFSRYYANSLANNIANSNPSIKAVFEQWKDADASALISKLEQNEDLKSVILQETPWILDAQNETEQKRRIGLLFDINHMSNNKTKALLKLQNKQLQSGGWPWFGGNHANRYITQHIVAGFGHLMTLQVGDVNENPTIQSMIKKALDYMDKKIEADFVQLKITGAKLDENHLSNVHVHYLYARSFFIKQYPIKAENKKAYQYYSGQAAKHWLSQNLYLQGMIALTNHRAGNKEVSLKIMKSLKDKALQDEEQGMYWRKNKGYYWSEAPIERQALLVEAFDQILDDQKSVEDMKLWLLKQKQTQSWETTKATANAIYALLLTSNDLLSTVQDVSITIGNQQIEPKTDSTIDSEAGTGYFKKVWTDVDPNMGNVTFNNQGENVAWGAVYWQYFEQLDKITTHSSPLTITKELYKEIKTSDGRQLQKIDASTKPGPGDRIIVRLMIQSDRDMEFIHLKDMRASGLEPVNVLSGMKYQGGLAYYEATKDAATHFFFDWLPRGNYVFEYPLYVAQKGNFSNGISIIQSMYAPEFSAHSRGVRLDVP